MEDVVEGVLLHVLGDDVEASGGDTDAQEKENIGVGERALDLDLDGMRKEGREENGPP